MPPQMRELSRSGDCRCLSSCRGPFRRLLNLALLSAATLAATAEAQVVRGTVSSAVAGGRVPGAVVLLLDSALTAHARALTSDSGTFTISAGVPGRFYLKVMHLGFQPTVSPTFDLRADTTIAVALTDIPLILPALAILDRRCRMHSDTTSAGVTTFALLDQARTAILAAAITLEEREYRFTKLLQIRVYDTKHHELRDVDLDELETEGTAPWVSLPAEQLRRDGYATEDDSGMTFYAPDLDVLLSPYFAESHCFRITNDAPPTPGEIGLDFEPPSRSPHVEIRGTIWLDSTSSELRTIRFTFVNLPLKLSPLDTLLGGHVDFERLSTGAWILPSWSIRMPTPVRTLRLFSSFELVGHGRVHWQLSTDFIRVSGGDLRNVKRNDSTGTVLWQHATGTARIFAGLPEHPDRPAPGVIVRLTGSPYEGPADAGGHVLFAQMMPGRYLFEATTALHDLIEATPARAPVTVTVGDTAQATVVLQPLIEAAAAVCRERTLDRNTALLAGRVSLGETLVGKARVTVEWPDGEEHADTRRDGWFRMCGIPTGKLLLIKATRGDAMATLALTLGSAEIVHPLVLHLSR